MMYPPPIKKKSHSGEPPQPPPPVLIPDELIAEILSFLPVKTITRFKSVCKQWNTLISDPSFTQTHLTKSSQNPHFILTPFEDYSMNAIVFLPLRRLLQNPSITVTGDTHRRVERVQCCQVIGSCNGLICLLFNTTSQLQSDYWFCFWNPATRTISRNLGFFSDYEPLLGPFKFSFGFDYVTGNYKVLALHSEWNDAKETENEGMWRSKVRVFSFADDCWRNIQSFPLVPLIWNDGVHLNGTVNWLAIRGDFVSMSCKDGIKAWIPNIEQFEIVSIDLSTERYTKLLLPSGFDAVPCVEPSLRVLMDCLCFSHDVKGTQFVMWQMKEFGVQESWTQIFRFDYVNLQMPNIPINDVFDENGYMKCNIPLLPLYLSKNGDTLILANDEEEGVIIYNCKDDRIERTRISNDICWHYTVDYFESLVSPLWKDIDEDDGDDDEEEEDYGEEDEEDDDQLSDIDFGLMGGTICHQRMRIN